VRSYPLGDVHGKLMALVADANARALKMEEQPRQALINKILPPEELADDTAALVRAAASGRGRGNPIWLHCTDCPLTLHVCRTFSLAST
jgi:hypothetical protein